MDDQGPQYGAAEDTVHTHAWGERCKTKPFRAAEDHQLEAATETSNNSPGYRALWGLNLFLARVIVCHPPKANPLFSHSASIFSPPTPPAPYECKAPLIFISDVLFTMLQMCYLQLTVFTTYFSLKDTA